MRGLQPHGLDRGSCAWRETVHHPEHVVQEIHVAQQLELECRTAYSPPIQPYAALRKWNQKIEEADSQAAWRG